MKVILICGQGGSGKDTLANYLNYYFNGLGSPALIIPNATFVKNIAKSVFMWNGIKDFKGRQLLIDIAQTGYNLDPHFWEKGTIASFNNHKDEYETLIIPDWRYAQTLEFFKNYCVQANDKIITIRVNRDVPNTHADDKTENDFRYFDVDFSIDNTGTLDDLKEIALQITEKTLNVRWD